MAIRIRLLATAAIPLIALTGLATPSFSAMPTAPQEISARDKIVLAQAEDDAEELKRKKRQERKERQQARKAAQEGQDAQDAGQAQQRKERQQARKAAQEAQQAEDAEQRQQRKERQQARKAAQDAQQAEDAEQRQQRKERQQARKAAQEAQQDQNAEERQQTRKERQQARKDAQAAKDAAAEEELRKKRRQKQADDAANSDNQQADQPNKRRNKDKAQNQDEMNTPDSKQAEDNGKRRPKQDERRKKELAQDPSKTTDTVELPVENGAAVLDSDKDAEKTADKATRERRKKQREAADRIPAPRSDRDAQKTDVKIVIKPALQEKGERITGFQGYERPKGRDVRKGDDIKVIFNLNGRIVVRDDDRNRVGRRGTIRYEALSNGRIREVVVRPNGDRVVTVRNKWGEIIRRSRIDNREREVVIFYSPVLERGGRELYLRDPGLELPPMRLRIPVQDYIIDVSSDRNRNYREFLAQPPVEQVERVYSVDEVKYSARIRDKVRRIDLDTITFDTGSAEVSDEDANSLGKVADAINAILKRDPGETFLIEGHTDAVGTDESNLVLSDDRAASVAQVLTDEFGVPAENLVTQGYGERFLKVDTDEAERMNRRVTIRRITSLVRPASAAANE